jgi:fructose-bisphosphate aldolase, class II
MALVNLEKILSNAYKNKYAVGSFNVVNDMFLEAILGAAEEANSPVILSIGEAHLPFLKMENICPLILKLAEKSNVPVCLNFDHGLTFENIRRAIDNGFTSIMFDGSKFELGENIDKTNQVVDLCRPLNISVEAELGAVGGDEGGKIFGEPDPDKYTDLQQAKHFVDATGVNALAIAIGNSHGKYKGEPDLDFDRLDQINQALKIPLVLHGGSGISEADFRKTIQLGIAKINYYTGMSEVALKTVRGFMQDELERYNDFLLMLQEVTLNVKEDVKHQMDVFGSPNQS